MRRLVIAVELLARRSAITGGSVFVDVIAGVDHRVDHARLAALGDLAIGVEVSEREVRARHHSHAIRGDAAGRQRAGRSHGRGRLPGGEPVIIDLPRLEPVDIHFHGEVALRPGDEGSLLHHVLHGGIARDVPHHGNGFLHFRRHAGPKDHGSLVRVARGNTMPKGRFPAISAHFACGGAGRGGPQTGHSETQSGAPRQPGHGLIPRAGLLGPRLTKRVESLPRSTPRRKHDVR